MSSLQRYKKSGGFFQLLSLIETFGPQKKEKFLEMIEGESAAWAAALREKMITLERVFGWPDQIVVEIFKHLPVKSQAFALQGLTEQQKAKVLQFFSSSENRRLNDVLSESQPKPEEVQATLFKIVEVARKMIYERELNPDKFDLALIIPEDFESKLEISGGSKSNGGGKPAFESSLVNTPAVKSAVEGAAQQSDGSNGVGPEILQLQKTLALVVKENKALKDEIKALQTRLDQIRKIA